MGGFHIAWFPDPNIGYVFGYDSRVADEGILVTFLGKRIRILFRSGASGKYIKRLTGEAGSHGT